MKKRILSILLLICLLATSVGALSVKANAAGQVYYNIDFSSTVLKSGIGQRVTGDCAVVSMATIESYLYGATTQAEKNKIYDAVVGANGAKAYAYWGNVGYVSAGYGNFSLQKLYDQLVQGYPVIVHRTGEHWSVVCGYTGSTSKLEESGFQVVDVYRDGTYGGVRKMNLTQWKGSATLDNYAYRKNGIAFTGFSGIRFAVNYPEIVHPTGNGHGVYGRVVSDTNLTSVNVSIVKATDGSAIFSKTVNPNAKSYSIYSLDSEMTFAKWSAGQYYYVITAKNASTTKIFTKYFTIGSSYPSAAPTQPVYTFAYNANGGSGSMASSRVTYNQSVTLAANAFIRDGYTFAGWNVQRSSDGRWVAAGQGWRTQAEITQNGYTKTLYVDKRALVFNTSWLTNGGTGACTYTFYAVWEKNAHTHNYTSIVTAPTCTEMGYTMHICSCGDSYVDSYVDALGHAWNSGVVTKEPTATETGIKTFTCIRCGTIRTESIPAKSCNGGANCPSAKFVDVNRNAWYHVAIDFAVTNNLFAGVDSTHFAPNGKTTRAMFVAVLWRLAGQEEVGTDTPFVDVKSTTYYARAVAWAAKNGIVAGADATHFNPMGNVTREQVATFLYRYAAYLRLNLTANTDLTTFPDANVVSPYAKASMSWAVGNGLISGTKEANAVYLNPKGNATRAQVAQILMNFVLNAAE